MRFLRGSPQVEVSGGIRVKPESVHLLTEYVLNLSMSARSDYDITPLYETYLGDARLGDFEREELMWVYMSLQLTPPATSEDK
ncbi:MAG TPA: hypothetical protein VEY12_04550 [Thermoplasmata archaeon]|nr:hypothetical protein [Thermoplasmata archaeon]